MGVDLYGKQGHMYFNWTGWRKILALANQYGWQPMGTQAPGPLLSVEGEELEPGWNDDDWKGDYFSNDRQRVTAEDAVNIAAALERAPEDIFDHDPMEDEIRFIQALPCSDLSAASWAFDWLSGGKRKKWLFRDFIAYCKADGFSIC
jgi:hypothetical protein